MSNITAHRDGQTREFTPKQWDVMGIGHCGWSAVPAVPKEIVQAVVVNLAHAEPTSIKHNKKRRK